MGDGGEMRLNGVASNWKLLNGSGHQKTSVSKFGAHNFTFERKMIERHSWNMYMA